MAEPKDPTHGAAVADEDPNYSPMEDGIAAPDDSESAHPERHFIVFFSNAGWQFTYRGSITGPFENRDIAVAEAIREARESGTEGVEVIVQEKDLRQQTVWRHSTD